MAYRTRADDMPLGVSLTVLAIFAVVAIGWIWNIVKLIGQISEPITAMFIARCVGVFAVPLGAVLGFF